MATVSGNNLKNFHLLISVYQRQAFKSVVAGNGLQILLMRVECSCGSEAPSVLVSPDLEILDSYLKVLCLLLVQQALTSRFNYSTLDQRSLVKSATQSIVLQQSIHALPVLQRVSCSFEETHPYDIYHEGDITLVTLGSVLARYLLLYRKGAIFLS
jgi:hypothetical protein